MPSEDDRIAGGVGAGSSYECSTLLSSSADQGEAQATISSLRYNTRSVQARPCGERDKCWRGVQGDIRS
jgi:hypothetical protein